MGLNLEEGYFSGKSTKHGKSDLGRINVMDDDNEENYLKDVEGKKRPRISSLI